jgi:hypothetical protein
VTDVVACHLVTRLRERPFEPPGIVAARATAPFIASGARLDAVGCAVGLSRHLRRALRATRRPRPENAQDKDAADPLDR